MSISVDGEDRTAYQSMTEPIGQQTAELVLLQERRIAMNITKIGKVLDVVSAGVFCGSDHVLPGSFHGSDQVDRGTFHS